MIKLVKNEAVKFVDEGSSLIPLLLADGWVDEETDSDEPSDPSDEVILEAPQRGRKKKHAGDSP